MLLLIIVIIMEKERKRDSNGLKYKYPERSCTECIRYPCFQGIKNCVCNFAKYGCKSFKEKVHEKL